MNFNIAKKIPTLSILLIFLVFMGCSSNYQWGWYVILPNNKVGLSNIEFLVEKPCAEIFIAIGKKKKPYFQKLPPEGKPFFL